MAKGMKQEPKRNVKYAILYMNIDCSNKMIHKKGFVYPYVLPCTACFLRDGCIYWHILTDDILGEIHKFKLNGQTNDGSESVISQ